MRLGMVGLGRMGANMAQRLMLGGHAVVANARTARSVDRVAAMGAEPAYSLDELLARLDSPRRVWLMLPAGEITDAVLGELLPRLAEGDILVDGGNSFYKDTLRRAELVLATGAQFVDVGTSGGIWGLSEGYSLMIGGASEAVEALRPLFETLAPAPDRGWGHVGPSGAGHFVKMVHNGIEYGMMQAMAEGFAVMERKEQFDLDLHQIAAIWQHGSVVRSWLLDLLTEALGEQPDLSAVAPWVQDSGEGRWTVAEAIELDQAAPVITLSLLARLRSRDERAFSDRVLAILRNKFGGHEVRPEGGGDAEQSG